MTGAFVLYTIAYILTVPFMKIYTMGITDVNYVDDKLAMLFAIMHLIYSSREASSRVINFAGHFKQMQWRAILESVINIVVSIVLAKQIGIYGVLFGTIVAYVYRTTDIILYANRKLLNRKCWETYKIWSINTLIFVLVFWLTKHLNLQVYNFWDFFIKAIMVSIVVTILYILKIFLFERKNMEYLFRFIKSRK